MAVTLEEAARSLGWTMGQIRHRRRLLGDLLNLRRGPHGLLLVDDRALSIFRRLKELESTGMSTAVAISQIREEIASESPQPPPDMVYQLLEERERTIRLLQEELRRAQEEKAQLLTALENLTTHALPRPRRESWWRRLIKRSKPNAK